MSNEFAHAAGGDFLDVPGGGFVGAGGDNFEAAPGLSLAPEAPSAILRAEPYLVPARGGRRSSTLHRLLALADVTAALTAGALTALAAGLPADQALVVCAAYALMLPVVAFLCGLYAADDLRAWETGVPDLKRMLFATLALSWPLFAVAVLLGAPHFRIVTLLVTVLTFVLAVTGRAVARAIAHRSVHLQERTAIVGSGLVAGELVQNLRRHHGLGLLPVGIVENSEHHRSVDDLPHLGSLDDLREILRRENIDRVIIAFTRGSHVDLLQAIRACRDSRVPVHVVPRLYEFLDGARALDNVGGMPILSLGIPRLSSVAKVSKRALDIVASSVGLLCCAPLFAIIALAIKRESPGPVFFRQVRAGRAGTSFELIKFRSMYEDADARKAELMDANEMPGGVLFKIRQDPRITRVGQHLRRYSLDELPQLWNVLRGQMSLVGPRPLVIAETEWLGDDWQARRSELRPGITGPWQIYGRSEVPFEAMVRFDYQYVAGWSLARDLELLCATIPAVLTGRGAY
jgi:exopolysaccharide biosynthesis polyprenyl glycosylphosphotransferase